MKKIQRILCFFFAVLTVILSFPVVTSAASTIDATSVYSDLKAMKLDLSTYKKDTTDNKGAKIIYFLEYAFDANNNQSDYGLYIYVYNPTCEVIDKNSFYNTVQLSSFGVNGSTSYSKKYKLIYISSSTEADGEGLANLYYKFKINVTPSFITDAGLNKDRRCYKLVDLELQYPGELNPRKSRIANEYVCTGFQENHGYSGCLPLSTTWNNLETISVELHPATWKTDTSDKGVNYQYEVSSVYFNIPNYYLEKYGDISDKTFKGLKSVNMQWYEYKINGLVSNRANIYNKACDVLGYDVKYTGKGSGSSRVDSEVDFLFLGKHRFEENFKFKILSYNYEGTWADVSTGIYKKVPSLHNAFYYSSDVFKEISTQQLLDGIFKRDDGAFKVYSYVDDGRTKGYNTKVIDVEDKIFSEQLPSYSSNHDKFITWLMGYGKLNVGEDSYPDINCVEMITGDDFKFLSDPEAQANALFVSEGDLVALKTFYGDMSKNKQTVYLMRFAVTDYYFDEVSVYENDLNSSISSGSHYFFEKTIFHNFDILDFTFKNSDGGLTIVPVSSKPITIVGSVTPNLNNQPSFSDKLADGKGAWDGLVGWLKLIILFVGLAVLFFVISKIASPFGKIIKFAAERSDKHYERRQKKRKERREEKEKTNTKKEE